MGESMIEEAHSELRRQLETCKQADNRYVSLVELESTGLLAGIECDAQLQIT